MAGEVETAQEYFIQAKTKMNLYDKVREVILKIHDYDTSEILAYEIKKADEKFLNWLDNVTID